MKIEKLIRETSFGDLFSGDVFISDGCVFLKVTDETFENEFAIDLEECIVAKFEPDEEVTVVPTAKLVM